MENLGENIEHNEAEKKIFIEFIEGMDKYLHSVSGSDRYSFHERVNALQGIIAIMKLVENNYDIEKFGIWHSMDFVGVKIKAETMVYFTERRTYLAGKVQVENPMPITINDWKTEA